MHNIHQLLKLITSTFFSFALFCSFAAQADGTTKFCASIRGNGAKIFVHTSSLARVHELYGMLWGISGGSSGSLVSFLVDSIYANPLIYRCGDQPCSEKQTTARVALLLKSFQEHPAALNEVPESSIFYLPAKISSELKGKNIDQMFLDQPQIALNTLKDVLLSAQYASVINQELFKTLTETPDPVAMAKDIVQGIYGASNWLIDTPSIFVRPGAISFPNFANYFGRLASFYALDSEHADRTGMSEFLNNCAVQGIGKPWTQVSTLASGTATCGEQYKSLLTHHFQDLKNQTNKTLSRADIRVGQSLHVLASVTQIENGSAQMWRKARNQYLHDLKFDWEIDFNDWSIAYMGQSADLDRILLNERGFVDLKTTRARVLKDMKWRDVLEHSPAEPSISRALEMEGGTVTTGGWMDSQPVQALLNIGCDKVIVLDTKFQDVKFQENVATLLGANKEQLDKLFSLNDPTSSVSTSVRNAAGIWCTNWNQINVTDLESLSALGWNGMLETADSFLLKPRSEYKNIQDRQLASKCF